MAAAYLGGVPGQQDGLYRRWAHRRRSGANLIQFLQKGETYCGGVASLNRWQLFSEGGCMLFRAQYGYRMSKAALNCAGATLARDLKDVGIPVALIHPGAVRCCLFLSKPYSFPLCLQRASHAAAHACDGSRVNSGGLEAGGDLAWMEQCFQAMCSQSCDQCRLKRRHPAAHRWTQTCAAVCGGQWGGRSRS
jgi:NAD(P)-dependent dehydrogenase (short-subunit alcohol dehydrogenase family)